MNKIGDTLSTFIKLFKYELKRYFTNIALLIISCILPILLLITLLGSLLPILFKGAEINDINVALFNEDSSFETNMIVRHLIESDSVEDFVDVIEVDSISEGKDMLEDSEISAFIHVPKNLQENLYQGESQTLYFYSGKNNMQIVILLYDMLNSGLRNINQAQKSVDIVYYAMQDMGYEKQEAAQEYSDMAKKLFTSIISRSHVFKDYDEVSATGDYLNIEYYSVSTMLICLFFLSLSICSKMSSDRLSGVQDRGIFNLNSASYFSAKISAGALFLLLPTTITSIFILVVSGSFGLFSGDMILMIITIILSSIYFTTVMICIGVFAKSTTSAIWIGFSLALVVSALSGIFIPRNLMPRSFVNISEITGLPAIIRLYGYSLFGIKNNALAQDVLKSLAVSIILYAAGYLKTRKRLLIR